MSTLENSAMENAHNAVVNLWNNNNIRYDYAIDVLNLNSAMSSLQSRKERGQNIEFLETVVKLYESIVLPLTVDETGVIDNLRPPPYTLEQLSQEYSKLVRAISVLETLELLSEAH